VKVLIDHTSPFLLAHGGFQTQIEGTRRGLEEIGLEVEWLRWWDARQTGDIIHFFGRPSSAYIDFAHRKGIRVVMAELLSGLGSRSAPARTVQKAMMTLSQLILPKTFTAKMNWDSYQMADACIAGTDWEAYLMKTMFGAPAERLFIVSNGIEEEFFTSPAVPREKWLVCTATITERKRVVEVAQAAVRAQVPISFIGNPYSEQDPYYRKFVEISKSSPDFVRYEGGVNNRAQLAAIYRKARGFVLLSTMESLSFSALEAAACELPLLLSDLPWARSAFANQAMFCPVTEALEVTANKLREFYEAAPRLSPPTKPQTWKEIGLELQGIYRQIGSERD